MANQLPKTKIKPRGSDIQNMVCLPSFGLETGYGAKAPAGRGCSFVYMMGTLEGKTMGAADHFG